MCLIITAFAAVITTLIWYFGLSDKKLMFGRLVLMYWGAALMWSVDGIFSVIGGEGFFDLSIDDAFLGIVVVLCGLIAWSLMLVLKDPKRVIARN